MNKKIIIITMLILLMLSTSVFAAPKFKDVPSSAWYTKSLDYTTSKGLINGYPDGTFKPNATLSRAEFTKVVVYSVYGEQKRFLNIIGKWYAPYYEKGEEEGLLPSSFIALDKEAPITRGEMALVISRVPNLELDTSKGKSDIKDYNDIPSNQQAAVVKTYQSGIINGYPDGTFKANETLSRAQLAKVAQLVDDREAIGEQEEPAADLGISNSGYGKYFGMDPKDWKTMSVDEKLNAWNGWTYNCSERVHDEGNLYAIINTNPLMLQVPTLDTMGKNHTSFSQAMSQDSAMEFYETDMHGAVAAIYIDAKNNDDSAYASGVKLIDTYLRQMTENPYKVTYKRTLSDSQIDQVMDEFKRVIAIDKVWKEENAEGLEIEGDWKDLFNFSKIEWETLPEPIPEETNSVVKLSFEGYNFYIQPKGGIVTLKVADTQHPDFDEDEYIEYYTTGGEEKFVNFGDEW